MTTSQSEQSVGKMTACPKCGLEAKTLLHPFCTHKECPIRDATRKAPAPQSGGKKDEYMRGYGDGFKDAPADKAMLERARDWIAANVREGDHEGFVILGYLGQHLHHMPKKDAA